MLTNFSHKWSDEHCINAIFASALINFYRIKCSVLHWCTAFSGMWPNVETRTYCTIFTRADNLTLSWVKWIQFTHSPLLAWRFNFNIMLSNMETWCLFQYSYYVVALTTETLWLSWWQRQEPFLLSKAYAVTLGLVQPPIQRLPAAVSIGAKQLGHEADCSPPLSAEVRNAWSSASFPTWIYMIWCFSEHRVNLTFKLIHSH
jgi:hypothetical protein